MIRQLRLTTISWLLASVLAPACLYQKLSVETSDDGSGGTGGTSTAGSAGASGNTANGSGAGGDSGGGANSSGASGMAGEAGDAGSAGEPPRILSLLSGKLGGCGFLDGLGSSARLPAATIVWDGQAYLYALSAFGIQKIAVATGLVTTVSTTGVGAPASVLGAVADTTGTQAFVALSDDTIVKQPLDGSASTPVAGSATEPVDTDGALADARFAFNGYPVSMTLDGAGNLYFAESGSSVIRELSTAGMVTTLAGISGMTGSTDGLAATFNYPGGVAFIGTNLYISDSSNGTIRALDTTTGKVSTIAGAVGMFSSVDGDGTTARFTAPGALAYDGISRLLVADGTALRVLSPATPPSAPAVDVLTIAGSTVAGAGPGGLSDAGFHAISSITLNADTVAYIGDLCAVRSVGLAGGGISTLAGLAPNAGSADGAVGTSGLSLPAGVAAGADGQLFVIDSRNETVRQVDVASAMTTTLAGSAGMTGSVDGVGSAARFFLPVKGAYAGASAVVDTTGNLFLTDPVNQSVRQIVISSGTVTTIMGHSGNPGSMDGYAPDALIFQPTGIAYDSDSRTLYVLDSSGGGNGSSGKLRKLTFDDQTVTTLAGGAMGINVDGTGAASSFNFSCPRPNGNGALVANLPGLAVYGGNVYVSDCGNRTVRKVEPSGKVTTIAGQAGVSGTADGVGTDALFEIPLGIASDGKGNLYLADGGASTLRKIVIATGAVTTIAGTPDHAGVRLGATAGLNLPTGVAVLADGAIAITDAAENALLLLH